MVKIAYRQCRLSLPATYVFPFLTFLEINPVILDTSKYCNSNCQTFAELIYFKLSFLVNGDFFSCSGNVSNSLDPDQGRQNVGPDLDQNG